METVIDVKILEDSAANLEPLPTSVSRLIDLAGRYDTDVVEVVDVIKYDPALTVKLLRAANSAMSGSVREITTVNDAVVRMGMSTVVALATSTAVSGRMGVAVLDLKPGELWKHSITAALAIEGIRRLASRTIPPAAMTVALLHDVGKLALAEVLRQPETDRILNLAAEQQIAGHEAERSILKINHTELGAIAARAWKLPDIVVDGISGHHSMDAAESQLNHAVLIADCVAYDVHGENPRAHLADALGALNALGLDRDDYAEIVRVTAKRYDEMADRFG